MEQQSFTPLVQDDYGKTHFHKELVSLIRDLTRSEEVISTLEKVNTFDLSDCCGNTLLHIAAEHNNRVATQYLVNSGCKIDVQNNLGKTPLTVATKNQCQFSTDVLLDANANIFISDYTGRNALHFFHCAKWYDTSCFFKKFLKKVESQCLNNSDEIAAKLHDAGWSLPCVTLSENVEVIKTTMELGSEVNARQPIYDRTALHEAVSLSNVECVKLLLDRGADPNAMDRFHRAPLYYVYDQDKKHSDERLEIIQLLISRGALTIISADNANWSQVDLALKYGNGEVIQFLLKANLDLTRKHENDNTPVHIIAANQNKRV